MSPGALVILDRLPLPRVMADPDGNEPTGNRNYGDWSRRAPYIGACGSVGSFPCSCKTCAAARSAEGAA